MIITIYETEAIACNACASLSVNGEATSPETGEEWRAGMNWLRGKYKAKRVTILVEHSGDRVSGVCAICHRTFSNGYPVAIIGQPL